MKIYSNFNPPIIKREKSEKPSLTEPDQSMSIEDIIKSFQEGVMYNGLQSEGFYDANNDDDFETDDFEDIFDAIDASKVEKPTNNAVDETPSAVDNESPSEDKTEDVS